MRGGGSAFSLPRGFERGNAVSLRAAAGAGPGDYENNRFADDYLKRYKSTKDLPTSPKRRRLVGADHPNSEVALASEPWN